MDSAATGIAIDRTDLATHTRLLRWAAHPESARPPRGAKLIAARHVLACRLVDREACCLRFARDLRVPPDSSGFECYIRMIEERQKESDRMRTATRFRRLCAIRSHLSTATKHGIGCSLPPKGRGSPLDVRDQVNPRSGDYLIDYND